MCNIGLRNQDSLLTEGEHHGHESGARDDAVRQVPLPALCREKRQTKAGRITYAILPAARANRAPLRTYLVEQLMARPLLVET